jgi:hypothetical protein
VRRQAVHVVAACLAAVTAELELEQRPPRAPAGPPAQLLLQQLCAALLPLATDAAAPVGAAALAALLAAVELPLAAVALPALAGPLAPGATHGWHDGLALAPPRARFSPEGLAQLLALLFPAGERAPARAGEGFRGFKKF